MKHRMILAVLSAVLFNWMTSGVLAQALGVVHAPVFAAQMALSLIPLRMTGCLADGLNKEIWLPELIEKFYPTDGFVSEARNLDAWTDNEYLNIAEAGVDPDVLVDNDVWPIGITRREDVPHRVQMHRFDTVNTVHINSIEVEESAAKRASVIEGHRKSLQMQYAKMAAQNWAPQQDSELTPVIKVDSGDVSSVNKKYYGMTYDQLLDLETRANMMNMPTEGRILLLHPYHAADLRKQDLEMYKSFFSGNMMFSFKIYITQLTPRYDGTTGKKLSLDAPVSKTDAISSTFYFRDQVGRAKGSFDMYYRLNDPEYRGDIVGFNMRGLALPLTNKYLGAIITNQKA